MKKLVLALFALLLFLPGAAMAASFSASDNSSVSVSSSETVKNAYLAGNAITSSGKVTEDLFAAGNTINVNGAVSGSLMAVGNNINVNAPVGRSVRVGGNNISLLSNVGSDVLAGGASITLAEGTTVGDDFVAGGSTIDLNGTVHGRALLGGGAITINGKVNGDVIIRNAIKVTIGDNAIIGGKLDYTASEQASISGSAKIGGETIYSQVKTNNTNMPAKKFGAMFTLLSFGGMLLMFITLFVIAFFLPKPIRAMVEGSIAKPLEGIGTGFVYLVVIPIAAIILLVTIIGAPIGLLALGIYAVTFGIAKILVPIYVGTYLFKWLGKNKEIRIDWLTILVGIIVSSIVLVIPVLGWLAMFLVFLLVLSRFAYAGLNILRSQR